MTEEFNMVVLAVGLNPPSDNKQLAEVFGIGINKYGFCKTQPFAPSKTTRKGIFVCGAFSSPKDIPETVMQASAAAGHVNMLLSEKRGTEITPKIYPDEIDVKDKSIKYIYSVFENKKNGKKAVILANQDNKKELNARIILNNGSCDFNLYDIEIEGFKNCKGNVKVRNRSLVVLVER